MQNLAVATTIDALWDREQHTTACQALYAMKQSQRQYQLLTGMTARVIAMPCVRYDAGPGSSVKYIHRRMCVGRKGAGRADESIRRGKHHEEESGRCEGPARRDGDCAAGLASGTLAVPPEARLASGSGSAAEPAAPPSPSARRLASCPLLNTSTSRMCSAKYCRRACLPKS